MNDLTSAELKTIVDKYNTSSVVYEGVGNPHILHQFPNGKIVNGYLSENNTLTITSVTTFLCE
jgi:hypothetical protein